MFIKTVSNKLALYVALLLLLETSTSRGKLLYFGKYVEDASNEISPTAIDKFNRHIHYLINAYRDNNEQLLGDRDFGDTKYKTWKRNGDLINSLLALPKDMDEAGR